MDASVVQFANLFRNGSSHIFNCRDLSHKIAMDGDNKLLFKTPTLNRAVFLKLPLEVRQSAASREGMGRFETKIYLPFEDGLEKGGQTVNFSAPNFQEVIRSLRPSNQTIDQEDMERDQLVLHLLESLPSLDPFLLKEKFRQAELDVDERYFTLTEEAWQEIRKFVMNKFRPMIGFAYPNSSPSELHVAKLTEILWEAKDDPDVQKMMGVLSIPPENIEDVLYAWKGVIYYEFVYTKNKKKINDFLKWIDQIGTQLGGITPTMKECRNIIRTKLANNISAMMPILIEHKNAYDELFIHKRNAKPFVSFISQCSNQFYALSTTVGQLMIIIQIWNDFNLRTNPYKSNVYQVNKFFENLNGNIF
jgi:hypothetical protein